MLECSSEPSGIDSARTSLPDVHTRGQAVSFPTEPAELDVDGERAPRLLWQQRRREPVRVRGCFAAAQTEGDSAGRKRGTRGARGPADGSRALRDNRRAGRRRAAPSRANLDVRVRRCASRGKGRACSPCDPGKDGVRMRDEPQSPSRLLPVWLLLLKLMQLYIFFFYFCFLSVPVFPPQSSDI